MLSYSLHGLQTGLRPALPVRGGSVLLPILAVI